MSRTPFFIEEGDGFAPTDACSGYWQSGTISGRLVGGLMGFVLERAFGHPDFVPSRFCVDLLRPPPKAFLRPVLKLLRDGGRLKLAHVDLYAGDELVAHASCQFLRRTSNPAPATWQTPSWTAPAPDSLETDGSRRHWELRPVPAALRGASRAVPVEPTAQSANPPVLGAMAPFDARQAWARETRALIAGTEHTPFTRVALAADFASPLANSSAGSIDFVNSDFTVYLHRLPRTEWVGFDLVKHHSAAGIAIGECWIYDEDGPLGTVNVAAVAQRQR